MLEYTASTTEEYSQAKSVLCTVRKPRHKGEQQHDTSKKWGKEQVQSNFNRLKAADRPIG